MDAYQGRNDSLQKIVREEKESVEPEFIEKTPEKSFTDSTSVDNDVSFLNNMTDKFNYNDGQLYRIREKDKFDEIIKTIDGKNIVPDYRPQTNYSKSFYREQAIIRFIATTFSLVSLSVSIYTFFNAPTLVFIVSILITILTTIWGASTHLKTSFEHVKDPENPDQLIVYGNNICHFTIEDYRSIEDYSASLLRQWYKIISENNLSENKQKLDEAQSILDSVPNKKTIHHINGNNIFYREKLVEEYYTYPHKNAVTPKVDTTHVNVNPPAKITPLNERIQAVKDGYNMVSSTYLDYQINPEHLIYRPLLLDINNPLVKQMNHDFNALTIIANDESIKSNIDKAESLLKEAKESLYNAYERATQVGTPRINERDKRVAIQSLKIVLNESATIEERKTYWDNLLNIVKKTDITQEVIDKINKGIIYEIETGKKHQMKQLTQ